MTKGQRISVTITSITLGMNISLAIGNVHRNAPIWVLGFNAVLCAFSITMFVRATRGWKS